MAKRLGKGFRIKLGGNAVAAITSITLPSVTSDQIDVTAMGDNWKQYLYGLKDGGEVALSGFFDPDDATGQQALEYANLEGAQITNFQAMIDNTSYLCPCQTTGYYSPTSTSGCPTQASYVNVTKFSKKAEKGGVAQIDFTLKVSGCFVLV